MAGITNRQCQDVPTYIDDEDGTPVRCRKASDSELTHLVQNCDEWLISAPALPLGSTAVKTLDRRLRALQIQLANPGEDWRIGVDDDFSLAAERLDWMLDHGRELFLGASQRIDRNGSVRDVGVILVAPYEAGPVCDVVVDLQRP